MMSTVYAVLGGGRQGTAAAYDMALFGDAKEVLIADVDRQSAEVSAERVNSLLNKQIARPIRLDVTDD
jgi:lysine 6-dehydrogenase